MSSGRFYSQNGVVVPANDAGDHSAGQLLANGEAAADVLAAGAPSARRVPAPQLRVRHPQRRVRRAGPRRLRVRRPVRPGPVGHRRAAGQRVRGHAAGGRPAGPASPAPAARGALAVRDAPARFRARVAAVLHVRQRGVVRAGGAENGGHRGLEAVAAVHVEPGDRRVEAPHEQRVPRPQVAGLDPVHGRETGRAGAQDIRAEHVPGRLLRVSENGQEHVQQSAKST